MALGVRVGLDRLGQVTDPGAQVGDDPGELAASGCQGSAQPVGLGLAGEMVQCLHERPVRSSHHRVAGPVEDERALSTRLLGELSHQAALAGARLAADQQDPAALAVRVRHQRPQCLQLGYAADEWKRRDETGCTGNPLHERVSRDDSQI